MDLLWNKFNLDSIDNILVKEFKLKNRPTNSYWTNEINIDNTNFPILIFKYKDLNYHLILDSIKKLFGVFPVDYRQVSIKDNNYLISYDASSTTLKNMSYMVTANTSDGPYIREIRNAFAFQWLIGLPMLDKSCILHRKMLENNDIYLPVSYNEKYSVNIKPTDIPNSILKEWFDGKLELLYIILDDLIGNRNPETLRVQIRDIITKIDESYISIVNTIYEKILFIKRLMISPACIELKTKYMFFLHYAHFD